MILSLITLLWPLMQAVDIVVLAGLCGYMVWLAVALRREMIGEIRQKRGTL